MERISEVTLKQFVKKVLLKLDVQDEIAQKTAEVIVEADVRGVDSHGVRAFANKAKQMKEGLLNAKAVPELIQENGATALFDGQHGYGPLLCVNILPKTIEIAQKYGIGLVTMKNSSHWGCPAYYSRHLAKAGNIGICLTNTNPAMPLWGSSEKSVGNNPLTIAAPRENNEPIVLDMAMQQVSWGKLALMAEDGQVLPELWGYDTNGKPTNKPEEIQKSGRPRPMGDFKGSGLAFMLEILTGVISSGLFCYEIGEKTAAGSPANYTQTFIAIKVDNFFSQSDYFARIEKLYQRAKKADLADGFTEIRLPGDGSNLYIKERSELGIPLDKISQPLKRLSDSFDIPLPW